MARFSATSRKRLKTCDERLQKIFNFVVAHFDCSIIEGYRGQEKQAEAFATGHSQIKFPDGKHNKQPSLAVDAMPYPIDWTDTERMYYFAGFVMATGTAMNIPIRWGGDWDLDTEILDNKFDDLGHFELV